MIEISGKEFPLVFSFDAIASIEAEFDQPLLMAADQIGARIEKTYFFLAAALGGEFTKEQLSNEKLPPLLITIERLQRALNVALFGVEVLDEEPEKPKKKPKVKSPQSP